MKALRLYGMHRAFTTTLCSDSIPYTNDELIAYLLQSEWDDRENRKTKRLTKAARFRYKANVEDIDFDPERNIDKNQILRFTDCDFINKKEHILITGSTGTGKSYITSAVGQPGLCYGIQGDVLQYQ